eukprot:5368297-Lingulodinium_polyedra.AAC.1
MFLQASLSQKCSRPLEAVVGEPQRMGQPHWRSYPVLLHQAFVLRAAFRKYPAGSAILSRRPSRSPPRLLR